MAKRGINLLEETTTPKTFWEKFYLWALTIGRFVVVGTEAIVLLVFIARFKLDRDLNDITDSLESKYIILQTLSTTEEKARSAQMLLGDLREISDLQPKKGDIYGEVLGLATEGTTIQTLNITNNRLTVNAEAEGVTRFNEFENSFKQTDFLDNVTIPSTDTEQEGDKVIYKFTLRADIKQQENE